MHKNMSAKNWVEQRLHGQRRHLNEVVKMISNIVALCLLICVTSVSPNSSVAANMPNETKYVENTTKLYFVPSNENTIYHHYSDMQQYQTNNHRITNTITTKNLKRKRRHTPFLPGDHWKGLRPDFGPTETDLEVMVNGTARMKCPITHVSDNRVSISAVINFLRLKLKLFCYYIELFLEML